MKTFDNVWSVLMRGLGILFLFAGVVLVGLYIDSSVQEYYGTSLTGRWAQKANGIHTGIGLIVAGAILCTVKGRE